MATDGLPIFFYFAMDCHSDNAIYKFSLTLDNETCMGAVLQALLHPGGSMSLLLQMFGRSRIASTQSCPHQSEEWLCSSFTFDNE